MASYRLAVAARYWHCARIVIANQSHPVEFWEPVGFLLGMATELALKAFAIMAGMSEKQLVSRNEMGHDLGKAVLACVNRGLGLSEDDTKVILMMRPTHLAHFYRYGFSESQGGVGAILGGDEGAVLETTARLIDLISGDPSVLRKLHQRPEEVDWPETFPPWSPVTAEKAETMMGEMGEYADLVKSIGKNARR